ncbi:N-6 DNA methylase [Endozoicomonadaceae bacterium StTr2]
MAIGTTIKSIQDIMRKDVGVDGDAQRIGQLVWMLFLKIFDDREQEWELFDDDYESPIPEELRWRNWAANPEGITGDELKQFIDNELFPELQELQAKGEDQRAYVIRNVFKDAYNYMKSGQLIRQVINRIQDGVDFNKAQERHAFGDMYEQILKDLQSAGNAGEFYTPRAVTEFMVNRVDPKLDESVMDPACGTGGFLTCAIEHKRKQYVKTAADEQQLQASIHGVEKKPLPHLLATTNMILHGIEVPSQIRHDNTLSRPLISWGPKERVDVIVANPPFGGMEEDGIETNFPAAFRTRETADLFMTLFIHLLKDGGRAAVVLPDGFLFGEGMKTRLKEKLLTDCNLHTIVRLPNGVFNPYTGIKTNLLFFTKGQPTEQVWYYEHPYPEGYKNYSKTRPMRFSEFETEMAWWGSEDDGFASREQNEQAWKVSIDEIKGRNYNLDIKNPHIGEQVSHDPDELLGQYSEQQQEMQAIRDQLKGILAEALTARDGGNAGNAGAIFGGHGAEA